MRESTDRRQRKTRQLIQNAFLKLAKNESIEKITIKEITGLADINRSTFYLHYCDIYDVYESIEEDAIDNVFCIIDKCDYDFSTFTSDPLPYFRAITAELDSQPDFIDFMTKSKESHSFLYKLRKRFISRIMEIYKVEENSELAEKINCGVTYICCGIFGVFEDWTDRGKKLSLEKLCEMLSSHIAAATTNMPKLKTIKQ